jgi:RNA polymerase sigma-70 factor (ECF subfamily)
MVSIMLSARTVPPMHSEGSNWVAALRRVAEGDQYALAELAFFDGLSHIEIAEQTRIPLDTIKSLIRIGMMRIRELLELQVGALS